MMKICAVQTGTLSASFQHGKNIPRQRIVTLNPCSTSTISRSNMFQGHKSHNTMLKTTRATPGGEVGKIVDNVTGSFDQAKDVVIEKTNEATTKVSELSGEAATAGKQAAADTKDFVTDKAKEGSDFVADIGKQAGDKVTELKDFAAGKGQEAGDKAAEVKDYVVEKSQEGIDTTVEKAKEAKETAVGE